MDEKEALKILKNANRHNQMLGILPGSDIGKVLIKALEDLLEYRAIGTPEELQDIKSNFFEALSDWRQYRKIGALEECRAAMEKQTDKKPSPVPGTFGGTEYECKNCRNDVRYGDEYCRWCGQKLDWGE